MSVRSALGAVARRTPPFRRFYRERDALAGRVAALEQQLEQARTERVLADRDLKRSWTQHHAFTELGEKVLADDSGVATQHEDRGLVERIIAAYQSSHPSDYYGDGSMWRIFREQQGELHDALIGGDVETVTDMLRHPADNYLLLGFECFFRDTPAFRVLAQRKHYADVAKDLVVRLAEAVGVIKVENPETGHGAGWGTNIELPTEQVVHQIEKRLSLELPIKPVQAGFTGLAVRDGLLTDRMIPAAYLASRCRELLGDAETRRVLEIGAGMGYAAYYARQLGIDDYTIVDLPLTNVAQAYFLGRTLGADAVVLEGERRSASAAPAVEIRTPSLLREHDRSFDLVANLDSLTELGLPLASDYADRILGLAPVFLSINHEANDVRVLDLLEARGAVVERFPYWLRVGYVEEIIRPRRV